MTYSVESYSHGEPGRQNMTCVWIPHDLGVVCNCVRLKKPSSWKQFSVNQGDSGFARILLAIPAREIKMSLFRESAWLGICMILFFLVTNHVLWTTLSESKWIGMWWWIFSRCTPSRFYKRHILRKSAWLGTCVKCVCWQPPSMK